MKLSEQRYIGFTKSWCRRGVYKHHSVTIVFDNSSKRLSFRCDYRGELVYDSAEYNKTYASQGKCIEACIKYIDERLAKIME